MRLLIRGLICLFCLLSCNGNEGKGELKSLVEKWNNKEIVFPQKMAYTTFDGDTVEHKPGYDYLLLSYIDSLSCISCKLNLIQWDKFIKQVKKESNKSIAVMFYISNSNKTDVNLILKHNKFYYPVCIDKNDSLNILNKFPSNLMFQTFLLNAENRVVAIGNPVHNNNIKQLHLNIISNRITDKQKAIKQTDLRVDKNILNMGQFDWLQEQQGCFILKNIGRNRLVINDVITSCSCVSVDYNKSPIEIGGEFRLTVKYKAEYPEYINKSILLYCNVKDAPIKLKIKGGAI